MLGDKYGIEHLEALGVVIKKTHQAKVAEEKPRTLTAEEKQKEEDNLLFQSGI